MFQTKPVTAWDKRIRKNLRLLNNTTHLAFLLILHGAAFWDGNINAGLLTHGLALGLRDGLRDGPVEYEKYTSYKLTAFFILSIMKKEGKTTDNSLINFKKNLLKRKGEPRKEPARTIID